MFFCFLQLVLAAIPDAKHGKSPSTVMEDKKELVSSGGKKKKKKIYSF
jgi:hypothetical protein